MNVLDEDIPKGQRLLLESWRVRVQQIGVHIGRRGMADETIPPMLLRYRRPTFFTRDEGFYDRSSCHAGYCLICSRVRCGTLRIVRAIYSAKAIRSARLSSLSFWRESNPT